MLFRICKKKKKKKKRNQMEQTPGFVQGKKEKKYIKILPRKITKNINIQKKY